MKKWDISNRWRASYLLMALGALNPGLNANDDLIIESRSDFSEEVGEDERKQQFAEDFLGVKKLREGATIQKGDVIGCGSFGEVYEGSADDQKLIIKQGLTPEKQGEMQIELENSNALTRAVAEKLRQDNPEYGKLIGLGSVVTVIGKTQHGSIIQEKVKGENLDKVTHDGNLPYQRSGYPGGISSDSGQLEDLCDAVGRAASFYAGLITIHDAGFVHCDIKPENVMVENSFKFPCRIIDLGGLRKIGEDIRVASWNGAPEFLEGKCAIDLAKEQQNKADRERKKMDAQIMELQDALATTPFYKPLTKSSITKNLARLQDHRNSRVEQLETMNEYETLTNDSLGKAEPSYDIYSSASILPTILFGKAGLSWAQDLYFMKESGKVDFKFFRKAQNPNFNAETFFIGEFTKMNREMQRDQGYKYPLVVLKRLASIQAQISDIDPAKRPSAIDVFEELQDMALADWEHGFYSIQ